MLYQGVSTSTQGDFEPPSPIKNVVNKTTIIHKSKMYEPIFWVIFLVLGPFFFKVFVRFTLFSICKLQTFFVQLHSNQNPQN